MPAKIVWFLPGFMGSNLDLVRRNAGGDITARRRIWLDVRSVLDGTPYPLLNLTGGGEDIVPSTIVVAGYGDTSRFLNDPANKPAGWVLRAWPYDWRRSAKQLGQALGNAIIAAGPVDGGHAIIAHSYGALVAWAAWAWLVDTGNQGLVSRVISIGGAFYGSYSTVETWMEHEDIVHNLSLAPMVANAFHPLGLFRSVPDPEALKRTILTAFNSWPAVYDLLPDPAKTDDPGDTLRPMAWDASNFASALAPPNPMLLTQSRDDFHSWLRRDNHIPPAGLFVHFVGTRQLTAYRMDSIFVQLPRTYHYYVRPESVALWQRRNLMPRLNYTTGGDGRLTIESQQLPHQAVIQVVGEHVDLLSHPEVLRRIYPILTSVPKPDPPPPVVIPEPLWPDRGFDRAREFPVPPVQADWPLRN